MSARIFISYARTDGGDAAKRLVKLLTAKGHSAWQDLRELGPEETVWPQIEKALKTTEFLIVLITPAALKSDYIRKEWREARRNGAPIMPVMAMEQSRSTLPRWLRRGEVYDLGEPAHREKFLARLNSTGGTFRADWDAGLEIETFIDRPRLFAQIKAQLLSVTSKPLSLTSALQGRGGYGKSVLAGEIARDPEIRDAYIDGVFWVSLGQDNPDVLGQINYLIRRISGAGGAPDVNTAAEELRRLLEKRDVLIILDDVWRRQDLYPFAKATGQGNASLLATTRKLDALPTSAQTIDISGMEPDEAVALLSYGLAPDATEQRALSAFAADFWHWPQLLAIVNGLLRGRLRDGDTLLHSLDTIAVGARRGVVPGTDERERTIANVMQMGIDDLDPADRERFKALAVVPEDTAIPVAIFAPLWGLSQYEAEEFARLLLDRRLIQSRDLSNPAVGARIRMHDDMLWYFNATTDDDAKRSLHGALLAAHQPSSGNWADLDQGRPALYYLWGHLLSHLEQAGDDETANALRIDYGWIKAKLNLRGIDELLADYRPTPSEIASALTGAALTLSKSSLEANPSEVGWQLAGRLEHLAEPEVAGLIAAAQVDVSFFTAVTPPLTSPGALFMRISANQRGVLCVAIHPDGNSVASGGNDGSLRLWDIATGAARDEPLGGHTGLIRSVAFSPDGSRIVSGGDDLTVRLWDASTGVPLGEPLRGHEGRIYAVAFSPDGTQVVSGGEDGTLRLWDTATGKLIGEPFRGHQSAVDSVAFSPRGTLFASGGSDGTLRFWDAAKGAQIGKPLRGHEDRVLCVAFSPDGARIVSGSNDKTVRKWDAITREPLNAASRGHKGYVYGVAVSPKGDQVVSCSDDGTLRFWDVAGGAPLGEPLRGHERTVTSVAFAPDGRHIVSGGDDDTVRLWNTSAQARQASPKGHERSVNGVAFSPDGTRVVSVGFDNLIRVWDTATGTELCEPLSGQGVVECIAFSPDGAFFVSGGYSNTLQFWDSATGTALARPLCGHGGPVKSIAFSPDGKRLVSGGDDRTIRIWDAATREPLGKSLRGHQAYITSLAYSPDGMLFGSSSGVGSIRLWDGRFGSTRGELLPLLVTEPKFYDHATYGIAFSPDSKLVAGAVGRTVQLWEVCSRRLLAVTPHVGQRTITCVAFSRDAKLVFSGSTDGILQIWDATSLQTVGTFHFDSAIKSISHSAAHIAIGTVLGNVHILRWRTQE